MSEIDLNAAAIDGVFTNQRFRFAKVNLTMSSVMKEGIKWSSTLSTLASQSIINS